MGFDLPELTMLMRMKRFTTERERKSIARDFKEMIDNFVQLIQK